VGMDPGPVRVRDVLAKVVGFVPAAGLGKPEGPGRDGEAGGRPGVAARGPGEFVCRHGGEYGGKFRLREGAMVVGTAA